MTAITRRSYTPVDIWRPIPLRFHATIGLVVVFGFWAGLVADSLFLWSTPLVAGLLLLGAQLRIRDPDVASDYGLSPLPGTLGKLVRDARSQISSDNAREMFEQLVRAATSIYPDAGQRAPVDRSEVEQLISYGCTAARDVNDIEVVLHDVSNEEVEGRLRAIHTRLSDGLQRGTAILHRARAATIESDPTHEEIALLLDELDEDTRAYAAALEEVESDVLR